MMKNQNHEDLRERKIEELTKQLKELCLKFWDDILLMKIIVAI